MNASAGTAPDPDCVFCRIVSGELPAGFVHATDDVVVFADLAPKAEVHLLVVPRRHVRDVVELGADPSLLAAVVQAAGQVAAEQADGQFRLVFNTGEAAGQTVFHAHAHVLAGHRADAADL